MKAMPRVKVEKLPRMADFAKWIAAASPALGWDADDFLDAYARNRAEANETTLGASLLVAALRRLGDFEGTATELLDGLVELVTPTIARSKSWPKSPAALGGDLRRLAPNLRRADPGLEIEFDREPRTGRRIIRLRELEWVCKSPSRPSPASPQARNGEGGDGGGDSSDSGDSRSRTQSNPGQPSLEEEAR